jgi:hypothetical protein
MPQFNSDKNHQQHAEDRSANACGPSRYLQVSMTIIINASHAATLRIRKHQRHFKKGVIAITARSKAAPE